MDGLDITKKTVRNLLDKAGTESSRAAKAIRPIHSATRRTRCRRTGR